MKSLIALLFSILSVSGFCQAQTVYQRPYRQVLPPKNVRQPQIARQPQAVTQPLARPTPGQAQPAAPNPVQPTPAQVQPAVSNPVQPLNNVAITFPADGWALEDFKLTPFNPATDTPDTYRQKMRAEVEANTIAFYDALQKDRGIKHDQKFITDTVDSYMKTFEKATTGREFRRHNKDLFRGYLVRRATVLFQDHYVNEFAAVKKDQADSEKRIMDKIDSLKTQMSNSESGDGMFKLRKPQSLFEILAIASLLISILNILIIFEKL